MNQKYKQIYKCEMCLKILPYESFRHYKRDKQKLMCHICKKCEIIKKENDKIELKEEYKQKYKEKIKGEI